MPVWTPLQIVVLSMTSGTRGASRCTTLVVLDVLRLRMNFLKRLLEKTMQSEISNQQKYQFLEQFAEHYRYLLEALDSTRPHSAIVVIHQHTLYVLA